MSRENLVGKRFGRLVVASYGGSRHGATWICVCDCGNITVVRAGGLRSGKTKSCRCLERETKGDNLRTHGLGRTPENLAWTFMIQRCTNKNKDNYKWYGGRGIKVCDRWRYSFENFLADMGQKPSPKHSIDRIDSDGDYCPENCRWSTHKEQCNNRSTSHFVTALGETKTLSQWAESLGVGQGALSYRIRNGWSPDEAILTPIRKCVKNTQ